MASVKCRAASKLVTNCFSFGDRFDQPGTCSEAFCGPRTSNLPPSKEGREGDCGRTNKTAPSEQKAPAMMRQPFIKPSLVPARPG